MLAQIRGVLFQACLVLTLGASVVGAQTGTAGLAGVAKDPSGAVLPGVTVEAASPALIEKVRTVVTDGEGQYKIVSLPPGVTMPQRASVAAMLSLGLWIAVAACGRSIAYF